MRFLKGALTLMGNIVVFGLMALAILFVVATVLDLLLG